MSMKSSRMASEAAQSAKLRRLGAQGSTKLAKQGENAMRRYANGGMVMGDDEDEDEDMMEAVEGEDAMPRLDRPSRGKKDKDKKGGSTVNVIIMPGGAGAAAGGPPMVPPVSAGPPPMPPPGPPMAGPPMGGPPMMPPGAGGPPMRKSGGSVNAYANGGKVKKADGGGVTEYMRDNAKTSGTKSAINGVSSALFGATAAIDPEPFTKTLAAGASLGSAALAKKDYDDYKRFSGAAKKFSKTGLPELPEKEERKSGGSVKAKHDDVVEDKKLVKNMVKGGCLK